MKKVGLQAQPLIAVADVEKSSRWYQRVLGCKSIHGGDEYDQLASQDGRLVLQLHAWDIDDDPHEHMGRKKIKSRGNGVLLWFQVDDFKETVKRAKLIKAKVLLKPFVNPLADHREIWLQDLDGYKVVIASRYGEI